MAPDTVGPPSSATILAIDTSTDHAGVALMRAGEVTYECSWQARGNHSRQLPSVLREMFRLQELSPPDVSAVVVASGPGSFSGVRVGISQAKGLALALELPLVGISTLDVIAFQTSAWSEDVWAITSAGRQHVNLARYGGRDEQWRRVSEYAVVTLAEAVELVRTGQLLAGDGAPAVAREAALQGHQLRLPPPPWRLRRTGFLAELGRRYLDAGGRDELDHLEPLYLRASAAEEKLAAHRQE